eukprot:7380243-Prymnesium_polylepis.2
MACVLPNMTCTLPNMAGEEDHDLSLDPTLIWHAPSLIWRVPSLIWQVKRTTTSVCAASTSADRSAGVKCAAAPRPRRDPPQPTATRCDPHPHRAPLSHAAPPRCDPPRPTPAPRHSCALHFGRDGNRRDGNRRDGNRCDRGPAACAARAPPPEPRAAPAELNTPGRSMR